VDLLRISFSNLYLFGKQKRYFVLLDPKQEGHDNLLTVDWKNIAKLKILKVFAYSLLLVFKFQWNERA
jgi:hypothetical protein